MKAVLALVVLALAAFARADSPLTSVDLFVGYESAPLVQKASTAAPAVFAAELVAQNDMGVIAAAVCKVGWSDSARGKAVLAALESKRVDSMSWHFAYGYQRALTNYLDDKEVTKGLESVNQAHALHKTKNRSGLPSLAIFTVKAMMEAQTSMSGDWCQIAAKSDAIAAAKGSAQFVQDLKPSAIDNAVAYMTSYHSDKCPAAPLVSNNQGAPVAPKAVSCHRWSTAVAGGVKKNQFYFNLRAGPNASLLKKVLVSEGYASEANAARGFTALLASKRNDFTCVSGAAGNQKGKWRLNLKNLQNGQIVGAGEGYTSEAACRAAGVAVLDTVSQLVAQKFDYKKCVQGNA